MLRFRLSGIPFAVTPAFWIGSAIFGANEAQGPNGLLLLAVWVICVLISIVLHELGHALAGRRFGLSPYVELYAMGGLTYLPGQALSRGKHLLVTLAGPAAGFTTLVFVWAARYWLGTTVAGDLVESGPTTSLIVHEAIEDLVFINGVWTLINLLPILPLDGGQALRDILGPRLGTVTRNIGGVCAVVCAILAYTKFHQPYLPFFLGYLAFVNFRGDARALPGGTGG